MITKEELWAMPVPTRKLMKRTYIDYPTDRKQWASQLYSYIFGMEESTSSWNEHSVPYLDEMILYFKKYGMPALAWYAKQCKVKLLFPDSIEEWDDTVAFDFNILRGIFHDERDDPIGLHDSSDERIIIERRYKLLKTSEPL